MIQKHVGRLQSGGVGGRGGGGGGGGGQVARATSDPVRWYLVHRQLRKLVGERGARPPPVHLSAPGQSVMIARHYFFGLFHAEIYVALNRASTKLPIYNGEFSCRPFPSPMQ